MYENMFNNILFVIRGPVELLVLLQDFKPVTSHKQSVVWGM